MSLMSYVGSYKLCVQLEWLDWPAVKTCRLTSTQEATSTCHPVSIGPSALTRDSYQYKVVRDNLSHAFMIQNQLHTGVITSAGLVPFGKRRSSDSRFCSVSQAFHGQLLLGSTRPPVDNSNSAGDSVSIIPRSVELDVLSNGSKVSTTGVYLVCPSILLS